jgi:polyvinyl alcohol dehydrogenase (cytochrome)
MRPKQPTRALQLCISILAIFAGVATGQLPSTGEHPEPEGNRCFSRSEVAGWNGWSPDPRNHRFQIATKITPSNVSKLSVRWTLAFPEVSTAANQPTMSNGVLFIGSWSGVVYAIDAQSGRECWRFRAEAGVRTAIQLSSGLVLFGDLQGRAYALSASTGELVWRQELDVHPWARITGAPAVYGSVAVFPVASLEEVAAENPSYVCCTFRGSIVALDVHTGRVLWKTYTVPEPAHYQGTSQSGTMRLGPSGAGIWAAPTIDSLRRVVYVVTGNNYSGPPTNNADAIIALDLQDGRVRWSKQFVSKDLYNGSCFVRGRDNCPEPEGPDFDFGASPILVTLSNGRDILVAGQKSGVVYALNPSNGEVFWRRRVGRGGRFGGILWGMSTDSRRLYVAVADWDGVAPRKSRGVVVALDLAHRGRIIWRTAHQKDTCSNRRWGCAPSFMAPVTSVPGLVFVGSMDGRLRVFSGDTGMLLWQFDTDTSATATAGSEGHGGSINGAGPTVVGSFVFQTSGYNALRIGMPGNILLAFSLPD